MKKCFLILFSFLYLLSSAGVAVNFHYCCNKLKSVSLTHIEEKKCCGKKVKTKRCCKEKSLVYKVNDSQDSNTKITSLKNSIKVLDVFYYTYFNYITPKATIQLNIFADNPPELYSNPTYLLNRVFRI